MKMKMHALAPLAWCGALGSIGLLEADSLPATDPVTVAALRSPSSASAAPSAILPNPQADVVRNSRRARWKEFRSGMALKYLIGRTVEFASIPDDHFVQIHHHPRDGDPRCGFGIWYVGHGVISDALDRFFRSALVPLASRSQQFE